MKIQIPPVLEATPVLGAVLGLICGIAANIYAFTRIEFECLTCAVSYGVPFKVAEMAGYRGEHRVLWNGVAGDLLVFVGAGILLVAFVRAHPRKRRKLAWEE
jgi:hypothetical protein